jgi:hypothetical protein
MKKCIAFVVVMITLAGVVQAQDKLAGAIELRRAQRK